MMARAATADELVKLRSDGQRSKLYLAIHTPALVYSARVNQAVFIDPIAEVAYDTGSGTLANVLPGMTLYVGTSAGAWDKGMLRIRKTPTAGVLYFGETSEIAWADNDYLTVVDEIGLWPRHVRLAGTTPYMDYDIGYSDQHALLAPYPVLGPAAVLWLPTGGTVNLLPDASGSWALGSAISSYLWAAPGASATLNLNTALPTITYNAAGTYRVSCLVTAANGKTTTGYRYLHVFSAAAQPVTDFELLSCQGSYDDGGWEFSVRMLADATAIRPRSRVILFAEDWYGAIAGSLGPVSSVENIIAMGWIDEESIAPDALSGQLEFAVRGAAHWLKTMTGYPVGIERSSAAATAWTEMQDLTVDRGLWHVLHWRTTASLCLDAFLPGDTRSLPSAEAPASGIWDQLETLAYQTILAKPVCDRYGRLYCQADTQFLSTAARAAVPVVMEITRDDWKGAVGVTRAPTRKCSMLQLSGIQDDTNGPLMSWARGGVFTLHGATQSVENLLLDNQADANALAGNYFAWLNNEFPNVDLVLGQNNRMIDIAPRQRVSLSLAAGDTPRGLVWAAKALIPRRVEYKFDAGGGYLIANLECEAETGGAAAVDGQTIIITYPPLIGDGDIGFDIPDFEGWGNWPALTPLPIGFAPPAYIPGEPQVPITPGATCLSDAPANGPYVVPITGTLSVEDTATAYGGIRVVIRTSTHGSRTTYELRGIFEKLVNGVWQETTDDAWYEVEGISASGAVVATGVHNPVSNPRVRTGYLDAPAATPIAYLRIRILYDLVRPTAVTNTSSSSHFWWPITDMGELKWGYSGPGIWVSLMNVKITGSTQLSPFGAFINGGIETRIKIGADYEFQGRVLRIRHNGYQIVSPPGDIQALAKGNFSNQGNWQEGPNDDMQAYLTQKHEFTATPGQDASSFVNIGAYIPALTNSFLITAHQFLTVMPGANYRMHLTQTLLWNVCPISG